eukprot:COSAG05_NODE_6491_length_947_cov_8.936902_1_plen_87_part_00
MSAAWAEKPALLRQGWLEAPEGLANDGNALVGYTVFVMGHGKGRILEFSKSRVGSSSHSELAASSAPRAKAANTCQHTPLRRALPR